MQDPLREIPPICKAMLHPTHQIDVGKKYLTHDVQLIHPQLWVKGRRGFLAAYQLWSWINRGLATFDTTEIMYSGKNEVTVRGYTTTHIILMPSFRLEFYINLHLTDSPSGKLIDQQHDHLLFLETFVYQLPVVGVIVGEYIPKLSGAATVLAMQLIGSSLNWLGFTTPLGDISPATPYQEVTSSCYWQVPTKPIPGNA